MKTKESFIDNVVYAILCIFTFGTVWFARIVISHAIRMALKDD